MVSRRPLVAVAGWLSDLRRKTNSAWHHRRLFVYLAVANRSNVALFPSFPMSTTPGSRSLAKCC